MALTRAAQIGKGALRNPDLLEAASRFGELDHMSTLGNNSQIDFSIAVCDLCVCESYSGLFLLPSVRILEIKTLWL